MTMIESLVELVAAVGLNKIDEIQSWHINHRINGTETRNYAELYPSITYQCLLTDINIPKVWQKHWQQANSSRW